MGAKKDKILTGMGKVKVKFIRVSSKSIKSTIFKLITQDWKLEMILVVKIIAEKIHSSPKKILPAAFKSKGCFKIK